jgi:hypothetical protein
MKLGLDSMPQTNATANPQKCSSRCNTDLADRSTEPVLSAAKPLELQDLTAMSLKEQ